MVLLFVITFWVINHFFPDSDARGAEPRRQPGRGLQVRRLRRRRPLPAIQRSGCRLTHSLFHFRRVPRTKHSHQAPEMSGPLETRPQARHVGEGHCFFQICANHRNLISLTFMKKTAFINVGKLLVMIVFFLLTRDGRFKTRETSA